MSVRYWLRWFGRVCGVTLLAAAVYVAVNGLPEIDVRLTREGVLLILGVVGILFLVSLLIYTKISKHSGWGDEGRPPSYPFSSSGETDSVIDDVEASDDFRKDLRSVVLDVLVRNGYSEVEAEELVESGGWTDDVRAAWYVDESAPSPGRARMLIDYLSTEGLEEMYSERALSEIEGLMDD